VRDVLRLVAVLVLFSASAAAETVLNRGNRFEPATLDPHKFQTHYEANVILDLFEGLLTYDAEGRPTRGVAESWKVSEDGRTWTFRLQSGLAWSDGTALTAEDVVYSFRRMADPKTAAQYAQLFYVVENFQAANTGAMPPDKIGVSAPDPVTVVFKLNAPAPYLPALLANAFAAVIPRHAVAKHGAEWVKPGVMVSNGAFALKTWSPNDRIELARNPKFRAADEVRLDRVVFSPTENLSAGFARFRAGELDMQIDFPLAQLDMLRAEMPAETKITPNLLTYYLALNTKNPKLSDVRVRRALSLAVERDVLTNRVTRAGELPAFTFVPPRMADFPAWTHVDAGLNATQRLATAAKLLAEAGYGKNKPLTVTYSFSNTEDLKRIAVAVAGMWKRVGVETELLGREGRVHFASLKSGDYEAGFAGWAADFNDASTFLYTLQSTTVNSNYSRYANAGFDALMARAAQEKNHVTRGQLLQQAEKTALADQPIIPLYTGMARNLVAKRVAGWTPNAMDFNLSRYMTVTKRD
jgi:oligopeptide transport system substrate-binding protein